MHGACLYRSFTDLSQVEACPCFKCRILLKTSKSGSLEVDPFKEGDMYFLCGGGSTTFVTFLSFLSV